MGLFNKDEKIKIDNFDKKVHKEFWSGFSKHIKNSSPLIHFGSLNMIKEPCDVIKGISYSGCEVGLHAFRVPQINIRGIGIWKRSVDLTEKEQIHSHFKWIKQNLEKLYWLVHLHETGCLNWE